MAEPHSDDGRDARGRFTQGNRGGPGGPRRRGEFQRAIDTAVAPEHISAMVRKATRMGLEGNLRAMDLVLNRTAGRPSEVSPEPEVLDLRLPDLTSADSCAAATDEVVVGITRGKVDRKTAKVLLDGIKLRMASLESARKAAELAGDAEAARPVSSEVLRACFRHFRATGNLPVEVREAAAVVEKVKAGYVLPDDQSGDGSLRDGFLRRERAEAPAMDTLLDEAVHGSDMVRAVARHLLVGFASVGLDVTSALLPDSKPPEFGSMAMTLVDFDAKLSRRPYKAQAARLFERLDAVRKAAPKDYLAHRRWHDDLHDALICFQLAGERPFNALLLEAVLVLGQHTALVSHLCGHKVHDVMPLFDATGRGGQEREDAIRQLQQLAQAGRFVAGAPPMANGRRVQTVAHGNGATVDKNETSP